MIIFYHFGKIWFISLKYMEFKKINTGFQLIPKSRSMKSHFVCACVLHSILSDFIEVIFHSVIVFIRKYRLCHCIIFCAIIIMRQGQSPHCNADVRQLDKSC